MLAYLTGDLLTNPNSYVMQEGGDTFTNYFIPAYYLKYDSGSLFSGANYPYGEDLFYTDAHPGFTWMLKAVESITGPLHNQMVGIIHTFALLTYPVCALFLFLILRRLLLPEWYAVAIALLITFMSPQLFRITGHFSLAHAYVIPVVWYLMMRLHDTPSSVWIRFFILATILFAGFNHMYFLPICTSFMLVYAGIIWLRNRRSKSFDGSLVITLLLLSITCLLVSYSLLALVSDGFGRSKDPFGFFFYHSFFGSVFLPSYGPIYDGASLLMKVTKRYESAVFVGIIPTIAFIIVSGRFVLGLIRKRGWKSIVFVRNRFLNASLWAAFILLLFSMALPFRLGMQGLIDYFPMIKQFRSPARFAWIFYYVLGVYAAYYFYLLLRYLKIERGANLYALGVVILAAIWTWDVATFGMNFRTKFEKFPNEVLAGNTTKHTDVLAENGYDISDFQAILTLPAFHIGSEKHEFVNGAQAYSTGMRFSYETGLPLLGGRLHRVPVHESMWMLQVFNPPFVKKKIVDDLPNNKLILVVVSNEKHADYDEALTSACRLIAPFEKMKLMAVLPSDLTRAEEFINEYNQNKSSYFQFNGFSSPDSVLSVIIENFDSGDSTDLAFRGVGALFETSGDLMIWNGETSAFAEGVEYIASVWIFADFINYGYPILHVRITDSSGEEITSHKRDPRRSPYNSAGWCRAEIMFTIPEKAKEIEIFLSGEDIIADELLIQPTGSQIFWGELQDGSFIYNNYFVSPNEFPSE